MNTIFKKRGFLTIYILLILSLLSISLTFIYKQAQNNQDMNNDLYTRKKLIYKLESLNNIAFSDKKRLIEFLEEVNEKDWIEVKIPYYLDYFGDRDDLLIRKIDDNFFCMQKELLLDEVRVESKIFLKLKEKYKLKDSKKIILGNDFENFFDDLTFKDTEFKKFDVLDLGKDVINSNLWISSNLRIKKEHDGDISSKESISNNFTNKSKTVRKINGIVIVDGDLILEKDLEINGLLIIKGDIILSKNKLSLNGQLIAESDYNIEYNYKEDRSADYINAIYNPKYIEIKSKIVD